MIFMYICICIYVLMELKAGRIKKLFLELLELFSFR